MSSPMSKSPELSDKSKKYDRQIRLWGEHGQSILENSNVCLINATAVGCEALKGLVLPGIGSFTIIDGCIVTEEDIGINFFLELCSVGDSKAKSAMHLLKELNPDVDGDYIDEPIENILQNRPEMFENFNIIIASNLSERTLQNLSKLLWDVNIPLFYCRSVGFFGTIRLQIKEHCVIEAHPDNRQHDLRLVKPFPNLKLHLESVALSAKIPWLIVLYKFLQVWSDKNEGRIPQTYKEKLQLRDMIKNGMTAEEENYEEAIKGVNSVFGVGEVTSSLKNVFDDESCIHLNKKSSAFWIMTKALKEFIYEDNYGFLPVPGILPDMTAETESYINLQNIYRQQAMHDSDNVFRRCQDTIKELGLSSEIISEKSVQLFCKEAASIAIIRGSRLLDEYEKTSRILSVVQGLETPGSLMENYVILRAYEKFQTEFGYIPGECNIEADTARLKTVVTKMFTEWGIHNTLSDDLIHELCRYGGSEIHSISAFIGGCLAHEAIKVLTTQYKPIDNTFVYDGITTESATFKL